MKKISILLLATVLMNVGYVFGQIDTLVLNEVSYTLFSRGLYVNVDLFPYPTGYDHCGDRTKVVPVTNPITGDIWMDRNLGASQAATASDDENSFGDLFQWGRFADGHQCRSS
nr:hypothetical protein [Saprospiraceae bacterium]